MERDGRTSARRPPGGARHLLRLSQQRSDDGAGSESDRAEHDRIRQSSARGEALSELESHQHPRQRRLPGLPRHRLSGARQPHDLGLSQATTYKWAHSMDNIEDRGAGQGDFQSEINGRTDNRFDPDYLRGPTTTSRPTGS